MQLIAKKKVEVLFTYDGNVLLSFTTDADEFWDTVYQEMNHESVPPFSINIPDEEDDTHRFYTRTHQHIEFFWEICIFLGHTDIEFERLQYYPEFLNIKTFVEEAIYEDEIYHSNDDVYDVDR